VREVAAARKALSAEIGKRIVGQTEVIDQLLVALFARGHCLFVGVPGLAKTMLIQTLSDALALSFGRIQFTPDLMPADITGADVLEEDRATGRRVFRFVRGPIFAHVVLADEVHRLPPRAPEGAVARADPRAPGCRPARPRRAPRRRARGGALPVEPPR